MVLPAIPSLSKIASDFFERNPELDEKSKAVVADLFTLFEQELGRALIYREERFQYKSIMVSPHHFPPCLSSFAHRPIC